jgi:hypothetical protein
MPCLGNGSDHCCYVKGEDCPFLFRNYVDENGHFRKWACSLRVKYGNWDDVLKDPEWQRVCGSAWADGLNCRDWPDGEGVNRGVCKECGVNC